MIVKLIRINEKYRVLIHDKKGRIHHGIFDTEAEARLALEDWVGDVQIKIEDLDRHLESVTRR